MESCIPYRVVRESTNRLTLAELKDGSEHTFRAWVRTARVGTKHNHQHGVSTHTLVCRIIMDYDYVYKDFTIKEFVYAQHKIEITEVPRQLLLHNTLYGASKSFH